MPPPPPPPPPSANNSISPSSLSLDAEQLVDCSPRLNLPRDWVFDESFVSPLIPQLAFDPLESLDPSNPNPLESDSDMSVLGLFGPSGRQNNMDSNRTYNHGSKLQRLSVANVSVEYFYQDESVNSNFPPLHSHHHPPPQDSMSIQNMATTTGSPPSSHLFSLSTNTPSSYRPQGSPVSNHSSGSKKRAAESTPADMEAGEDEVAIKRQKNTMAARKYRQKRLDRITDLERALGDMTSERDQLKLQLARREAEVEALREMLAKK